MSALVETLTQKRSELITQATEIAQKSVTEGRNLTVSPCCVMPRPETLEVAEEATSGRGKLLLVSGQELLERLSAGHDHFV